MNSLNGRVPFGILTLLTAWVTLLVTAGLATAAIITKGYRLDLQNIQTSLSDLRQGQETIMIGQAVQDVRLDALENQTAQEN